MDWYISEKTEDEYLNHTAGIKAREDLETIWKIMVCRKYVWLLAMIIVRMAI